MDLYSDLQLLRFFGEDYSSRAEGEMEEFISGTNTVSWLQSDAQTCLRAGFCSFFRVKDQETKAN